MTQVGCCYDSFSISHACPRQVGTNFIVSGNQTLYHTCCTRGWAKDHCWDMTKWSLNTRTGFTVRSEDFVPCFTLADISTLKRWGWYELMNFDKSHMNMLIPLSCICMMVSDLYEYMDFRVLMCSTGDLQSPEKTLTFLAPV